VTAAARRNALVLPLVLLGGSIQQGCYAPTAEQLAEAKSLRYGFRWRDEVVDSVAAVAVSVLEAIFATAS
jgi:hypothetical protein